MTKRLCCLLVLMLAVFCLGSALADQKVQLPESSFVHLRRLRIRLCGRICACCLAVPDRPDEERTVEAPRDDPRAEIPEKGLTAA